MSRRRLLSGLAASAMLLAGCAGPEAADPARRVEAPRVGAELFRAADGADLPMRSWLPEGKPAALIIALHGFADYSASFARPASFWAAHGIATFAYDQRGFGGSPHTLHWAGAATMAADARDVVAALRRRYPGVPAYLLGESMGGAVAIVAATSPNPADIDGVILVSPAVWDRTFMGLVERSALSIATFAIPNLWLEAPRQLNIHPSNNIPMLRAMARDSLVQKGARADTTAGLMDLMDDALGAVDRLRLPTLVLYGAHEEVLPRAAVEGLLARLPTAGVTAAEYPNGYHMLLRDLDGDIVSRDILSWIEDRKAPLPSGDACRGLTAATASCGHSGN